MANPRLHWRALATREITGLAIDAVLDEIYDAITNDANYANTNYGSRGGAAQQWTVEREQETGTTVALGLIPPAAAVSDLRVLLVGHTGSPTPTMRSPSTFLADTPLVGIVKGITGETLDDWDAASPYGGGIFSGYHRAMRSTTAVTYTTLYIYESEEAIFILLGGSNFTSGFLAGAIFDPGLDADGESNGRIYGMTMSGSSSNLAAGMWDSNSASKPGGIFFHSTANGLRKTEYFLPGTSDLATADALSGKQTTTWTTFSTATTMMARPVPMLGISTQRYVGKLREILYVSNTTHNNRLSVNGVETGYFVGARPDTSTENVCLLLT